MFFNRGLIKSQFTAFKRKLGRHQLPSPIFLFDQVSFMEAISLKYWALVWSTYSLIDPRYAEYLGPAFGFRPYYFDPKAVGSTLDCFIKFI